VSPAFTASISVVAGRAAKLTADANKIKIDAYLRRCISGILSANCRALYEGPLFVDSDEIRAVIDRPYRLQLC
jgi:hypothetical protein